MINYRKVLEEFYSNLDYTYEGNNPDYDYEGIDCNELPSKEVLDDLWHTKVKRNLDVWKEFDKRRKVLLQETDHFGLSDQTMTQEMSEYRQALRDLPTTAEPNFNEEGEFYIDWPIKPE